MAEEGGECDERGEERRGVRSGGKQGATTGGRGEADGVRAVIRREGSIALPCLALPCQSGWWVLLGAESVPTRVHARIQIVLCPCIVYIHTHKHTVHYSPRYIV